MPVDGSINQENKRVGNAMSGRDVAVSVTAASPSQTVTQSCLAKGRLILYTNQTAGDNAISVTVQLRVARQWRTIDTFVMTGSTDTNTYIAAASEWRVQLAHGGGTDAAGWILMGAIGGGT